MRYFLQIYTLIFPMPFQNLLLIDDDEDDQEIFLTAARKLSQTVNCIALFDATEALEKLYEQALAPDVIFLDLNMPVMNGEQFLVEIKKQPQLKHIPVIIFTTSSNYKTKQQMKALGAHDFLTKPERFDDLINLLKPILI